MKSKRTMSIDGIEYQFNGDVLKNEVNKSMEIFRKKINGKGSYWKYLAEQTGGEILGLSRTTVREWYTGRIPSHPEDLIKLLRFLDCDWDPILKPVNLSMNNQKYETIRDTSKLFKNKMKELNIGIGFLGIYLEVYKGYQLSYYNLWKIVNCKMIPTEELCNDIMELFAIVAHNTKSSHKNPFDSDDSQAFENMELEEKLLKKKMDQLGLDCLFIYQYLYKVKNYDVNWFLVFKIIWGFRKASKECVYDILNLYEKTEASIIMNYFPVVDKELLENAENTQLSKNYKFDKVCTIVFSTENSSFFDRRRQIKRFERFANQNRKTLNESYTHFTQDTSWYSLRNAADMVENGFSDGILLYSHKVFYNETMKKYFLSYAKENSIPVIFLSDLMY